MEQDIFLPSSQLIQDGLCVGRVEAVHVCSTRVGHTRHDLVYLVHGGGASEEGFACEGEEGGKAEERKGSMVGGLDEGMVLSSYMVNACQARLPVTIQKVGERRSCTRSIQAKVLHA